MMNIAINLQVPVKTPPKSPQADPKKKVEEFETEMIANCNLQTESDRKLFASEVRALCETINQSILMLSTSGHSNEEINAHIEKKLAIARESLSVKLKVFEVKEAQFKAQSIQFDQKRATTRQRNFVPIVAPRIERKKAEISQCLLVAMAPGSPFGAMPCLQKCSEGLNEEEKKELEAAVPDLVAGKFITELASAPAMVSEAIDLVATGVGKVAKGLMLSAMSEAIITADPANYDKHMREAVKALNGKNPEVNKVAREMVATAASGAASVAKVMLLSAMSEGIATADPYHYDERMKEAQKALNGENPEFNQVMREMFVDPVRRTNQAITDLDKYTQKKYYTVPGIVRKGMIGTAEIGLVFAGPAVRGGATLVQKATTSTGQVVKRAFTFNSSKAAKTVSQHFQNEVARNKPFLHRFDYSHDYLQAKREFITAKEFEGILSKDLLVVRYHNSTGTHKWFMPISEGNKHWTVNEIKDALAKLDKFGEVTHVSVARIPAGEPVRFLHGRAKQQIDVLSNETRPGGGVQYRFFDFDPRWIKETREIPGVKHPRK